MEISYKRNTTTCMLYILVIMIIIAQSIFNTMEAGNGRRYYGRLYNTWSDIPTRFTARFSYISC